MPGHQPAGGDRVRTITIDGQQLPEEGKALAHLRADVGMVFQSFNLFSHKTVLENVTLGIKVRKKPHAEAKQRGMELLKRVGVESQAGIRLSCPAASSSGWRLLGRSRWIPR